MFDPTTYYFVRHGQTFWNVGHILQGQLNSQLTDEGIQQANFRAREFFPIKFDAVYASDLDRARMTAEIIAKEHHVAVCIEPLLRERCFGKYEGRTIKEMRSELKDKIDAFELLPEEGKKRYKFDDSIESDWEVIERMQTFIKKTQFKNAGKTVLAVTHGGLMRAFLTHLGVASRKPLPGNHIQNLGYFVLETDGESFEVVSMKGIEK